jgi:hypothetical protein
VEKLRDSKGGDDLAQEGLRQCGNGGEQS